MEEAIPNSRKRNLPSPRILTRSRSQLFLHLNRSGQFRSDPRPRKDHPYTELVRSVRNPMSRKKAKRDDHALSGLPAKDLRARRIYSPPESTTSDSTQGLDSDCTDKKITESGFGCAGNGDVRNEASESPDLGPPCEAQGFGRVNTESLDESRKLVGRKRCDGTNGGNFSENVDDLEGQHVLKTPPDAEVCGSLNVNDEEAKRGEDVRVKDAGEGSTQKNSQGSGSAFKSKSVLGPRFHGRLFKAPGSVNYRRLFPFLMDSVGSDSGTPKLSICQKDGKGIGGREFQLSLSYEVQKPSKQELKTESCTTIGTNGLNTTSAHDLVESPMQLDSKEGLTECLSEPFVDDICLSEADATAEFHGVKDVGSSLHNGDFKQYSAPKINLDYAKAGNPNSCPSQQSGILNEECIPITVPDAETYDSSVVIVDQSESMPLDMHHIKPQEVARSTQEVNGEGHCLKADKENDSLKRKFEPQQHLHRKFFKAPGSVSYKRMLPYLMDRMEDGSGILKFDHQTHHEADEVDMNAKIFQPPLSSDSEEASIDDHKTDGSPGDGTVESNGLESNILDNPSNELSHSNQPYLTSYQDLSKLPKQLDAKDVEHDGLSAPSLKQENYKDECLSECKFDPCSLVFDNIHSDKHVANGAHDDEFKQVQNRISGQHSESPPKNPNVLNINADVSDLTFEHPSSKEDGLTGDDNENNQLVILEEFESVGRRLPEGQGPSQMDPAMLDAEENGTGSHTISRSDGIVVLNHVQFPNEGPRSPLQKAISEKLDMAGHGGDEAGSVLNGTIFGSRMPSIASNNKNASEVESGFDSKTISVLRRPRIKLLKHAGSFNYKRLLPFILNNKKDNSCGSVNDHCPKLQKFLDQTPLPISASNLPVIPISDSNRCVPVEQHCAGNSCTRQQKGLHACDLKNDRSSPKSDIQSSRDSCKLHELQDEQVVSNILCQLESSTDPSISLHGIDLPIIPLAPKSNDTRGEKATSAFSKSSVFSGIKGNSSFLISSKERAHESCQSLSQPKVFEQHRVTTQGFKRGILKRNPRGCRGLCTCLNCVSFRLHAERAFEFSRNQLLDAEEVTQALMKELSHVRNMLERSTDSDKNNPVLDVSQVQEACRKALAAEQLAKDRLSQMNEDLNVHCRIMSLQRPRVTFADQVEVKVIRPDG